MIKLVFGGSNSVSDYITESLIDTLTQGKIYEGEIAKAFNGNYYLILKNDKGKGCLYPKSLFKSLEEIRSEKLNIIFS